MALKDQHAPLRELLAVRLDRPLTRVESRTLTAHLKSCPSCQQADAEYRANHLGLRALSQPIPPRDMWARTSAALDREVARGARAVWGRRMKRARRKAQPSSAVMSALAAVGVVATLVFFQLGPALTPAPSIQSRPTPFAVDPQPLAFLGLGASDLAIYRMTVSEVCPQTATLDCIPAHKIVRTPIALGLPNDLQANNAALSPTGDQMVLVGKKRDSDVIAVVMMPAEDGSFVIPTESVGLPEPTGTPEQRTPAPTPEPPSPSPSPSPEPTASADPNATDSPSDDPNASATPARPTQLAGPSSTPGRPPTATPAPTDEPEPEPTASPDDQPIDPPASSVAGLAVVSILEDVHSVGAPPAWSRNGEMLAFSAMPVDGSHGPDVYVWSPSDTKARPITTDHESHFASWSGNRIVISRVATSTDGAVVARNYVIDPGTLEERRIRGGQLWLPAVNRQRTQAVVWQGQLGIHDDLPELRSGGLFLMPWTAVDPFRPADPDQGVPGASPDSNDPDLDPGTPAAPALSPLVIGRDSRSAPVADWQAGWSPDGRVLGIWIADSVGSTWGRLTVLAIDPETGQVVTGEPLLRTTLARRGFSLGTDRVVWVAPSDTNVDGELRLRAWTSDGVGGLRVVSPEQEGVLPAF